MASLKLMQMKLKNLISAVSGAATEVSDQSRKFEATSAAFSAAATNPRCRSCCGRPRA